jgi:hypothetical protein
VTANSRLVQLNPAVQRWMLANIDDMRWKEPTPIQMQVCNLARPTAANACILLLVVCVSGHRLQV